MSEEENNERVEDALAMHRQRGERWARVPCPFCADMGHDDKKTSLGVNVITGVWHCFRCGESGKIERIIDGDMYMESLFPNGKLLQEAERTDDEPELMQPPDWFEGLWTKGNRHAPETAPARRYLVGRGVRSVKLLKALQIGCCTAGYWGGRIIVPFTMTKYKGWLGWVGRLWRPKPHPKAQGANRLTYLYPKGVPRGRFLYNHDAIHKKTEDPVIVVEGVFDTFPYWPDAVATLGKPSDMHIEALQTADRPVVWIPDGDEWEKAEALTLRMRFDGKRSGYVKLPPRTDPDEVPKDWLMNEARKSLERKI